MNFIKFRDAVKAQFDSMCESNFELFRVAINPHQLADAYLLAFPEGSNPVFRERTEHDCNCCKSFIRAVGNVVAINDKLELVTIWDVQLDNEPEYQCVADTLANIIRTANIKEPFYHFEGKAGTKFNIEAGETPLTWEHFYAAVPTRFINATPGAKIGEANGQYQVALRGLTELRVEDADAALDLINENALYRGAEFKASLEAFKAAKAQFDGIPSLMWEARSKHVWKNLTPAMLIRNTAIGTLLVDLAEGVDLEKAVKSFEAKVAPANYKRPSAVVTPKMLEAAREAVANAGLTESLARRHARINDVPINDVLFVNAATRQAITLGDPFAAAAEALPVQLPKDDKIETINIEAFIKDVLPNSTSVQAYLSNKNANRMVTLLTSIYPEAPNLLKWGNLFSWSYMGDFTDAIQERVKAAGGSVEGDVRFSLSWFNYDDLDLSVEEATKGGGHIVSYRNRTYLSPNGGTLDVDMNAGSGKSRDAVENIVYKKAGSMKDGTYEVFVHNFCQRESVDTGFVVQVSLFGEILELQGPPLADRGRVKVATLKVKGGNLELEAHLPGSKASKEVWGLQTEKLHEVRFICNSPNYWGENKVGNKHYFFMLQGAVNDDSARGFYNEFLKPELDPHRKAMELVGQKLRIESDPNQLSGIGFSSTQKGNLVVLVTKDNAKRFYNIIFA